MSDHDVNYLPVSDFYPVRVSGKTPGSCLRRTSSVTARAPLGNRYRYTIVCTRHTAAPRHSFSRNCQTIKFGHTIMKAALLEQFEQPLNIGAVDDLSLIHI